jgi:hypothetical protein
MAANPPRVTKYVDGIFQDDWTTGQSLDNPAAPSSPPPSCSPTATRTNGVNGG